MHDAQFTFNARATLVRGLPKALKRPTALELLVGLLDTALGDMAIHTLNRDLLVVDHVSPTTLNQKDNAPVCFITLGLIRECLYWATGEKHDIEERECRAAGAKQCEFKITTGE